MTRDIITLPAPLPRAELTSTLTELGVRRVRILAAVVADVYVIVDPDTGEVNHDRIAHEIADAVTYRARPNPGMRWCASPRGSYRSRWRSP
jgi:hypothetical protein